MSVYCITPRNQEDMVLFFVDRVSKSKYCVNYKETGNWVDVAALWDTHYV